MSCTILEATALTDDDVLPKRVLPNVLTVELASTVEGDLASTVDGDLASTVDGGSASTVDDDLESTVGGALIRCA